MKRSVLVRLLALLLGILTLSLSLVACDEKENGDASTTTSTTTTTQHQDPPVEPAPASTVAQLEISNGMCYVVRLKDGRFIVIDGGVDDGWEGRAVILNYLNEHNTLEGKPVIACWMITHFDGDHFDNAYSFWKIQRSKVEIQGFAYTIPDKADFAPQPGDAQSILDYKTAALAVLEERLPKWESSKEWFPNATYWDMQAGEVKTFSDVQIKILMTANERIPESVYTNNQRSAVWKMTFTQDTEDTADDKTFMVFGDNSGNDRNQWIIDTYGADELKSDVMQVIHHGLAGGYKPIYQAVNPDICFWPTPKTRFEGKWDSDGDGEYTDDYQYCTQPDYNQWLRAKMSRKHYHHTQTVIIDMSDLSVTVIPSELES